MTKAVLFFLVLYFAAFLYTTLPKPIQVDEPQTVAVNWNSRRGK